mmetsp:Transcript_64678/g.140888  ORF Transcript_64678/g.140888 Transcript_64678/m.140888 type:complete len:205 (+) Transcript_64678:2995-3609(+)
MTCHSEVCSSFTAQIASARTPASLEPSRIRRINVGISSGHCGRFWGRSVSSRSIIWFPRLWMMSATFLRTLCDDSASKSCSSCALLSAFTGSGSCDHVDPSSLILPRHCLSSTAACSFTASSICVLSTWKSAATVVPACCLRASVKRFSAAFLTSFLSLSSARSVSIKSGVAMSKPPNSGGARVRRAMLGTENPRETKLQAWWL